MSCVFTCISNLLLRLLKRWSHFRRMLLKNVQAYNVIGDDYLVMSINVLNILFRAFTKDFLMSTRYLFS